jgi:hypothetical protein
MSSVGVGSECFEFASAELGFGRKAEVRLFGKENNDRKS